MEALQILYIGAGMFGLQILRLLPSLIRQNYPIQHYQLCDYVDKELTLQTEFMDRNLGATDAFPVVAQSINTYAAELARIRASTGMHYQWGRKDPLPTFTMQITEARFNVFLGTAGADGTVTYSPLR